MAAYGRLGPLDSSSTAGTDFIFDFTVNRDGVSKLAPRTLRRTYSAIYADVPVALSDHLPKEWKANAPADISIEFEVVGEKQKSVDDELKKLRKFMRKDRRTGEPIDLLLILGKKQWAVRIDRMENQPVLWTENADEMRVKVSMQFHTIKWEDSK